MMHGSAMQVHAPQACTHCSITCSAAVQPRPGTSDLATCMTCICCVSHRVDVHMAEAMMGRDSNTDMCLVSSSWCSLTGRAMHLTTKFNFQ